MTEGLDFDPTPFQEASRVYEKTGMYTNYKKGTKPYKMF
jgi:hypothetical protein